jgi:hypothetical protein
VGRYLRLTVFADLTVAVEAALRSQRSHTHRIVQTTSRAVTADYIEKGRLHILQDKQVPSYVTI